MEEFTRFIVNNWQDLVQYVLIAVAYFFAFLFNSKVNNTSSILTNTFKERTSKVDRYEKRIERLEKTIEALLEEKENG